MTPLIDVALVLVVILLVATPMAFQSSIGVQRAAQAGQAAKFTAKSERIEITVVSSDSVFVNRSLVSREQVGAVLRPLLTLSATKTVVVRCGDNVPHGAFVSVLDEAKAQGASQISVVGG